MNNLVSIILPAYNAEKTISRTIQSVVDQSYPNWELIIINDGSTDKTLEICSEYAKSDSRVQLQTIANSGVAIARQTGLSQSKGAYIIHLDSDDYMEKTMLDEMVKLAENSNADIVVCDFKDVGENNNVRLRDQSAAFINGKTNGTDFLWSILDGKVYGALWNKLIKRDLFNFSDIYFYEGVNYSEDVLALAKLLDGSDYTVVHLNKALYNYTVNENSLTRKWSTNTFKSLCSYYEKISETLKDNPRSLEFKSSLKMGRFSAGFLYGIFSNDQIGNEFKKVRNIAYKTTSIRWKLGYFMIDLHLYSLAKKLLAQ